MDANRLSKDALDLQVHREMSLAQSRQSASDEDRYTHMASPKRKFHWAYRDFSHAKTTNDP